MQLYEVFKFWQKFWQKYRKIVVFHWHNFFLQKTAIASNFFFWRSKFFFNYSCQIKFSDTIVTSAKSYLKVDLKIKSQLILYHLVGVVTYCFNFLTNEFLFSNRKIPNQNAAHSIAFLPWPGLKKWTLVWPS